MKLETLTCNNCGGPLMVPDSANFITCNHCASQLAIRRTESATFTEQIGELRSNQKQMMEQLVKLQRQNRLMQIEQEWELEREKYMIRTKNGPPREPSERGAILGGIVTAGFGVFWTIFVASMPGGMGMFAFFGLIFILFAAGIAIHHWKKAKEYEAAYRRYLQRKSDVDRLPAEENL